MMKLMVALVVLLAAATTTTTTAARAAVGFSVLTGNEGLFVYDSLEALKTFTPKIIPIPLNGSLAVSMAADEASGRFIVLGKTAVAALDASSGRFKQTFSFSPYLQFLDVAFAEDGRAVALGRLPNFVFQRAVFATTTDGGFTWNISSSLVDGRSDYGAGRIAFSGNNGVMTLGAYIATSSDSGRTWSPAQGYPTFYTCLALNQRVSIAAGADLDGSVRDMSLTTDLWKSINESKTPDGDLILGVAIASPQELVMAAASGLIWRTTNGGLTWTQVYRGWGVAWRDLTYSAALKVYLAVGRFESRGHYYAVFAYSADGVTWFNSPNTAIPLMWNEGQFIRTIAAVPSPLSP